ncbi:hypothetical protein OV450_7373 [Actinobacteria bacterium OV450]|nr:hypothetical protein OV450_7373 [Actinobacteria bacterium OV450]
MPVSATAPPEGERPHLRAAPGDRDRAVGVGAQDGRAQGPQVGEGARSGVPVAVALSDGDDREPGPHPGLEAGILVGRAVVGDLQDVDRPQFRMCPQKGLLGRWFEVPEQQQGQARRADQQGDAGVVGPLRPRAVGRGPEHLPLQGPGPAPLARRGRHDGYVRRRRGPPDEPGLGGRLFQRGGLNHTHRPAAQHPGQASDVVGVKVRQQEQWHPAHPQGTQARVHRARFGARVHHDGRVRAGGEHGGVALAHRALDVAPVGRRPAGERTDELRRPQDGQEQQ